MASRNNNKDRSYGYYLFALFLLLLVICSLIVVVRAIYNALTKPKKEEEDPNIISMGLSPDTDRCLIYFRRWGYYPKGCVPKSVPKRKIKMGYGPNLHECANFSREFGYLPPECLG